MHQVGRKDQHAPMQRHLGAGNGVRHSWHVCRRDCFFLQEQEFSSAGHGTRSEDYCIIVLSAFMTQQKALHTNDDLHCYLHERVGKCS